MSTSKSVDEIVETGEEWGVSLPDGTVCICEDEKDAREIVGAAKIVHRKPGYRAIKRIVYYGEWIKA